MCVHMRIAVNCAYDPVKAFRSSGGSTSPHTQMQTCAWFHVVCRHLPPLPPSFPPFSLAGVTSLKEDHTIANLEAAYNSIPHEMAQCCHCYRGSSGGWPPCRVKVSSITTASTS